MKTVIVEKPEQETWRDGTPMVCSVCGQPILRSQPRYATNSHSPKKRDAYHYFCQGGTITLIGAPASGVMEISQYG
jgi:hypothetical protein